MLSRSTVHGVIPHIIEEYIDMGCWPKIIILIQIGINFNAVLCVCGGGGGGGIYIC